MSIAAAIPWILTAVGLVFTIYAYRQTNLKRLSIVTRTHDVIPTTKGSHVLDISFQGQQVHQLYFIVISIINSGKRDLTSDDIVDFFTLYSIYELLNVNASQGQIIIEINKTDSEKYNYNFKPSLLKIGEKIDITCYCQSKPKILPEVNIRAKDFRIKIIEDSDKNWLVKIWDGPYGCFLPVILGFFISSSYLALGKVLSRPVNQNKKIDNQQETKDEITLKIINSLRNVRFLHRSYSDKQPNHAVVDFDSTSLPSWSRSELEIVKWSGPSSSLMDVRKLNENKIKVKVDKSKINKNIYDLKDSDVLYIIEGDNDFPFTKMLVNGDLK